MAEKKSISNFIKTLGPGILFASTAIGVSHLVQSTRAGAEYGFALIAFVIAANVFKYPFFEYGSRYANATGTTIIDGYNRIGKWMIWIFAEPFWYFFVGDLGDRLFVRFLHEYIDRREVQNPRFHDEDYWSRTASFDIACVCIGTDERCVAGKSRFRCTRDFLK